MAKVSFKRIASSTDINNVPIVDGQITYTKDGKTYLDYEGERVVINGTPDTTMSDSSNNAIANNTVKSYIDASIGGVETSLNSLTPIELYNNVSGTTGTVNLSETSANFTYLEIFFKQQEYTSIYSSVKVYEPNGKQVSLVSIQSSNGGAGIVSAYVLISGNSITKQDYNIFWTNGSNTHTDKIYITRVVGYR